MKTPHKHAALIHAWADGAEIEFFHRSKDAWCTEALPSWGEYTVYRIKPEPKPDYPCGYVVNKYGSILFCGSEPGANLKLTFDGETVKLKAAEVL